MKGIISISFGFILLATFTSNCDNIFRTLSDSIYMDYDHQKVPYKFYSPASSIPLHHDLEEISGLSMMNNRLIAAVEDENGLLYILNPADGKIIRKIKFGNDGDYEGVEVIGIQAYIMKSNGNIYQFEISDRNEVKASIIETTFSKKNDIEGITSDGKYLFMVCKGSGDIKGNKTKGKAVYRYDLSTGQLIGKEFFKVGKDDLIKYVNERKFFNKIHRFRPSAIAMHPLTSDIYVLGVDKILVVFTSEGRMKEVVRLDRAIYRQPEGLCFAADGTMFIASEGDGAKARIFKLVYNAQ